MLNNNLFNNHKGQFWFISGWRLSKMWLSFDSAPLLVGFGETKMI